ncbi:MAG: hypothetical protein JWN99_469 [Ilumatobacteraceae bacterium]|jgi:hypothetical protein|nr:hypothetical protein [Ilumatobacteraceae bacterium]
MGMFKDMRTLTKQAHEIEKTRDVKGSMAQMQTKMQAASAMMAGQMTAMSGVATTATVVAARPTGTQINAEPVIDMDLTVFRNGMPVPMTHQEAVPQIFLARLQPGANLHVKIDPSNPTALFIDWQNNT